MFWVWFYFVLHVLMLIVDAGWWVFAMRFSKRKLWRVLTTLFIALQMAAHLALMSGLDWRRHAPPIAFVAVVTWHFFAFGVAAGLVLPLALIRAAARRISARRAALGVPTNSAPAALPTPAPGGAPTLTRRDFFGACAAFAPPLFTIGLTGIAQARLSQLRVRHFTLPLASLPRALDGLTIVHVTDIHLGGLTSSRVLRAMVNRTNNLRPDLVVVTGDLINFEMADLTEGISLVKAMEGRYGQWMVEGNHDLFIDGAEFERRVKTAGLNLLVNESKVVEVRGCPVQFFGLGWLGALGRELDHVSTLQLRELMRHRRPDAFPILLAHHPHAFDAARAVNLPLTLAGHTHGGFWMLDQKHGIGPLAFRYWSGLYTRNRSHLIVANGVGNWSTLPPMRLNAPEEIVHITLRSAS